MADKKTVLIVEDEKALSGALLDKLSLEGFSVELAENGEQCLEKIKNVQPDLILLDLIMPKMTGIELLNKLKMSDEIKNTSIIVLTNISDTQKVSEVVENGVFDYFVKSNTSLDEIVEKVKEKMGE